MAEKGGKNDEVPGEGEQLAKPTQAHSLNQLLLGQYFVLWIWDKLLESEDLFRSGLCSRRPYLGRRGPNLTHWLRITIKFWNWKCLVLSTGPLRSSYARLSRHFVREDKEEGGRSSISTAERANSIDMEDRRIHIGSTRASPRASHRKEDCHRRPDEGKGRSSQCPTEVVSPYAYA